MDENNHLLYGLEAIKAAKKQGKKSALAWRISLLNLQNVKKETLAWLENKINQLGDNLYHESKLQLITLIDFLTLNITPRELILSPWLPKQGLAMLYAKRGVGKTPYEVLKHKISS